MTFELLKVCRQANPAWIEWNWGTYKVRNETKRNETKSTKMKRNETKSTKWKRNETKPTKAKQKTNYLFFISLFRFVFYFFPSIFFILVYFVLLSLVSFHFVSISLQLLFFSVFWNMNLSQAVSNHIIRI
jgi:VIT1/CCC1 family predicted Fe2+/Mn2+ transporter